ncbi:MAG: phosphodiesterase [Coriobacteriaceae bacterium]|jgi:hypothetical protein|nr:phosphodiesterase [Coriobacteriaceae bacterium]
MKIVIASDIHGSAAWCRRLLEAIEQEAPDQVILLGDLLYHGPRNPLPDEYAPAEVAAMLNGLASRVTAVRGNCDAEVDQMLLDFPCMADSALVVDGATRLFCTHGHVFSPEQPPALPEGSLFLSGHTHVKVNEVRDGIRFVNPGSVSLPKDGTHSFAVYEGGVVTLKELTA